jgi:hypothetical protein
VLPWTKAQPVDPALHTVWLLDNTAFRTPQPGDRRPDLAELRDAKHTQPAPIGSNKRESMRGGSGCEVEYVACYFIKNSGRDLSRVISSIAHELQISDDDIATKKRISERLQPFVDTVLPKRTLRISIADSEEQTLGPSSYSGISSDLVQLHFNPMNGRPFQSSPVAVPPPFGVPSMCVSSSCIVST